jgi:hypothetical protein
VAIQLLRVDEGRVEVVLPGFEEERVKIEKVHH